MDGSSRTDSRDTFRPDIEGLRGVAILLVVLYHSSLVVGIPGGFVGVDVFFVVSGFLITGLLLRERERSGSISLPAFYARRVRRLLPAGVVALACTLVASFVVLAPLDRAAVALDAAAAALSIGNIRFALAEGDYFAAVTTPSPLLHYWSLAVEEQFYLVARARARGKPGAPGPPRRRDRPCDRPRRIPDREPRGHGDRSELGVLLAADPGLAALAGRPHRRRGRPARPDPGPLAAGLGWVAVPALGAAALAFDGSIAYPGAWALVPTLAAGALIVSGPGAHRPGRLLALWPLRFLGRISYSLYPGARKRWSCR